MTTRPQPEPHLDANQLTAFAEGALSASERALCLQHLADCADCREIAFLAGASLPSEVPASAPSRRFSWSTWWPAFSLGAAALAAAIITAVLLHRPHQTTPQKAVQIASESSPAASPAPTTATSMNGVTEAEPRAHTAHKPSPAQKASPKPEAPLQGNTQNKDAAALGVMVPPAHPAPALPQQPAVGGPQLTPGGKTLPGTSNAAATPMASPQQAQVAGAAKASPNYALRSYNEAYLRSPDGFAQISGTIADSSGATIAHAKIALSLSSDTDHRETFTGADGRFTISSLQPGKYHLEISSPGFITQVREVDLGTGQLARVDSKLAVGSAAETIAVQAAAPDLKTEAVSAQAELPDKQPLQTSVTSGPRTLALDTLGQLFLSKKAGKHWKAVHGPWKKSALTSLSLTPDNQFRVSTSQDSWLSSDGEHWHPAH